MPRYDPKRIEARWQKHWDEHRTFATPNAPPPGSQGKLYVLDMFPYPSGSGLHVGHPEGYTATDIVCRYQRMRGRHVLHPMGWDAFGLPAEQHAIKTGTHPRITTDKNIDTFRRQLKMLGFSYDWSRELSTTDDDYFRWTQWIFLQIYDSWYDPDCAWTGPDGRSRKGRGRPIDELPIPDAVRARGQDAVRRYQDQRRLAYISEAPVNWCPALGTVLANEEVIDGKSERGGHPVVRIPLRQWMLRITAYADRLLDELELVNWPESIKALQRNWIGRSTGAEVDFRVEESGVRSQESGNRGAGFERWKADRARAGLPAEPEPNVLRIYTTRPDTLFGATYMVVAPEHPIVDRITTPDRRAAVTAYREQAARKSDLDRTDLAREKTGVFTGAHAVNPVNGEQVPIWIADYVLISYGTGAIMAVPAHDERDFEFANQFQLPFRAVVQPTQEWLEANCVLRTAEDAKWALAEAANYEAMIEQYRSEGAREQPIRQLEGIRESALQSAKHSQEFGRKLPEIYRQETAVAALFRAAFTGEGTAIHSGTYDGLPTREFKRQITADLAAGGLGREAVNYRLRDWLFSRQHFWGEPFPIWHELDQNGEPTGLMRADPETELPVRLPDDFDFKPHGRPEPPLEEAPEAWLYQTAPDGTRLKRETNSMPQWAGSCWYYLRFCDPKNTKRFIDPAIEKYWLPVDLYIGGAEHAVLHLLYSRFWHKVLFDRGHVSTAEPFHRLVNQGMILGEAELTGYVRAESRGPGYAAHDDDPDSRLSTLGSPLSTLPSAAWVSVRDTKEQTTPEGETVRVDERGAPLAAVKLQPDQVAKKGDAWVLKDLPGIIVESRAFKMSKSRGNVVNPDDVVAQYGADALRLYEMFMGPLEQVKPWSMSGVEGVHRFLGRVWRMCVDERADQVVLHPAVQDVPATPDQDRLLHKTIKAVTDDIEKLSFNTAISRMMEFTNELTAANVRPRSVLAPFVLVLSPFAPHLAEELWALLGHRDSLAYEPWPQHDDAKLVEQEIEVPVQINGKVRARITVPAGADQTVLQKLAEADDSVRKQLAGKQLVKVVVVPGRMVNFVVKG
jgi:leucyl-tRNA synthetase